MMGDGLAGFASARGELCPERGRGRGRSELAADVLGAGDRPGRRWQWRRGRHPSQARGSAGVRKRRGRVYAGREREGGGRRGVVVGVLQPDWSGARRLGTHQLDRRSKPGLQRHTPPPARPCSALSNTCEGSQVLGKKDHLSMLASVDLLPTSRDAALPPVASLPPGEERHPPLRPTLPLGQQSLLLRGRPCRYCCSALRFVRRRVGGRGRQATRPMKSGHVRRRERST